MYKEQELYSTYCINECPLGKKKAQEFLRESDSISDAAIDMLMFVDACKEAGCQYREILDKSAKN